MYRFTVCARSIILIIGLMSGSVLFSTVVEARSSQDGFLCGASNVFLAEESMVVNLLDSIAITKPRANGGKPRFPKRGQCGLPGENWRVCVACSSAKDLPEYRQVLPFLADKTHREWHAIWHKIRREISADSINSFPPERSVIEGWQRAGWIPANTDEFVSLHRIGGPLAGEDFFYMHRQMIKMLQIELANLGGACLSPWTALPNSVLDSKWPAPRAVEARNKEHVKAEQRMLDEIIDLAKDLRNPEYIRERTLSEFGNAVEAQIHGKLHLMYASVRSGCRDVETDDSIECDELTHDRSAHLNQYFWKLHGFIDQMIGEWLKVHGKTEISTDCSKSADPQRCYQWRGTWLGRLPAT